MLRDAAVNIAAVVLAGPQTERGAGLRSGERSRNQSVPPPFPYSPDSVLCVVCSMLSVVCWVLCSVLTFDRVPCQPFKVSCFLSPGRGQGWCVVGICFHSIGAAIATQDPPLHLLGSLSRPHFNVR